MIKRTLTKKLLGCVLGLMMCGSAQAAAITQHQAVVALGGGLVSGVGLSLAWKKMEVMKIPVSQRTIIMAALAVVACGLRRTFVALPAGAPDALGTATALATFFYNV